MALLSNNSSYLQKIEDGPGKSETNFHKVAELTDSAIFIFQGMRIKYANPATV